MTTITDFIVKIIVPGCGFPNFTGTSTYIRLNGSNILVDTGSLISRDILINNLNAIGVNLEDIDHLILTHMHMDHYGNMDLFKNAKIYLTKGEYIFHQMLLMNKVRQGREHVIRLWKSMQTWKSVANNPLLTPQEDVVYDSIKPFTDDELKRMVYVEPETEIIPGVRTLGFVGHSYCHIGLYVTDKYESVIISADAFPNKRWFDRIISNNIIKHKEVNAYIANLKKIRMYGKSIIIPGHDLPFDSENGLYLNEYLIS